MRQHVYTQDVLILESTIANRTCETLGTLGLKVFVTLVSLLKHLLTIGTCPLLYTNENLKLYTVKDKWMETKLHGRLERGI